MNQVKSFEELRIRYIDFMKPCIVVKLSVTNPNIVTGERGYSCDLDVQVDEELVTQNDFPILQILDEVQDVNDCKPLLEDIKETIIPKWFSEVKYAYNM